MRAAAVDAVPASPPELSLAEGRLWCELIERRSGLQFPESQWRYLRRRLWERMQLVPVPTYDRYYRLIAPGSGAREWALLLEDLLNPETSFFRHQPSFAALRVLLQAERRNSPGRPLELWSAGCSTGEEAYSLAMTGSQYGPVPVLGSDLNRKVLEQARAGVFAERQVTQVPPALRSRFLHDLPRRGFCQVADAVRSQVSFEPFHLLDSSTYPKREFDVIFCFNVLIYFSPAARQEAARHLLGRLRRGGHLLMAPGESAGLTMNHAEPVRLEGTQIWRRASQGG